MHQTEPCGWKFPRPAAARALLVVLLLALPACGPGPKAPSTAPSTPGAADPKRTAPAANDVALPDIGSGAMDIVVSAPNEGRKLEVPYTQKAMTAGSVRGFCFMKMPAAPGAPQAIDAAKQTQQPQPKEAEFYAGFPLREPVMIAAEGANGAHAVAGAVILVRGIRFGPRAPLERPVLSIWCGNLCQPSGMGVAPFPLCFAMRNDRLQIRNHDPFQCTLAILDADGKAACEEALEGNTSIEPSGMIGELTAWNKHKEPGGSTKRGSWMKMARLFLSPPLGDIRPYTVFCRRHAWQRIHLVTVDNPYATASGGSKDMGKFTLDQLPVGRHTLEVWHPLLTPARKTIDVEVKESETLQVEIEFSPPANPR